MIFLLISAGLLLCGSFACLFAGEKIKGPVNFVFSAAGFIVFLIPGIGVLSGGPVLTGSFFLNSLAGRVNIAVDPLSAFFGTIILFAHCMASLYSIGYMKVYENKGRPLASHYFFQNLLVLSMLLIVMLQNAFAFLIAWEIMSLSSFFLIIFESENNETLKSGLYYLAAMHIGVLFLIAVFAFLSVRSGSFDFGSFKAWLDANGNMKDVMFLLFFIGFGTKAGFFPFHSWLPRAHPAAPSPISALMSGVMIKIGIYGILRVLFLFGPPSLIMSYFVLFISLFSSFYGIITASLQKDLKKLLAYSSIENIGIIGTGIGVGLLGIGYQNNVCAFLGFAGALFHILNHSLIKPLLFFGAGAVYRETHTRNMEKLGGLMKAMPYTGLFFLTGSIAVSALPPLAGFAGEFLIYLGFFKGLNSGNILLSVVFILSAALTAWTGAAALISFTKAFGISFLGRPRSLPAADVKEAPLSMTSAMGALAVIICLIGLFSYVFIPVLQTVIAGLMPALNLYAAAAPLTMLRSISVFFWIFLAAAGLLFLFRQFLIGKKIRPGKTWGCGYQAGTPRMQYTGESYAGSFLGLTGRLFGNRGRVEKPVGLFPQKAGYESALFDRLDRSVLKPLLRGIAWFLDLFSWIQSGKTQYYLIYGLVFLFLAVLFVVGVRL